MKLSIKKKQVKVKPNCGIIYTELLQQSSILDEQFVLHIYLIPAPPLL